MPSTVAITHAHTVAAGDSVIAHSLGDQHPST